MSIYTDHFINDTICSIYVVACLINNKKYIGFTKRPINVRWDEHVRASNISNNNSALYRAMRKHGVDNFVIQAIYQSKNVEHTHNVMENHFITEYNTHVRYNQGYNSSAGGIGNPNPSIETRYKIGSANRGKKRAVSDQTRLSFTKHKGDFISPSGEIVTVNNFEKFARDNNLTVRMLVRVNRGLMKHHRGWTSARDFSCSM